MISIKYRPPHWGRGGYTPSGSQVFNLKSNTLIRNKVKTTTDPHDRKRFGVTAVIFTATYYYTGTSVLVCRNRVAFYLDIEHSDITIDQ